MSLVQHASATVAHVLPPERLRAAVLGRRVKLPDATAALVAELVYGAVHREHDSSLPMAFVGGGSRS